MLGPLLPELSRLAGSLRYLKSRAEKPNMGDVLLLGTGLCAVDIVRILLAQAPPPLLSQIAAALDGIPLLLVLELICWISAALYFFILGLVFRQSLFHFAATICALIPIYDVLRGGQGHLIAFAAFGLVSGLTLLLFGQIRRGGYPSARRLPVHRS